MEIDGLNLSDEDAFSYLTQKKQINKQVHDQHREENLYYLREYWWARQEVMPVDELGDFGVKIAVSSLLSTKASMQDDSFAMSFQSMAQYRTALIQLVTLEIDRLCKLDLDKVKAQKAEPEELSTELFELLTKSARRCNYDFIHAAEMVNDKYWRDKFLERAGHYSLVFNSGDDMKNYRAGLVNRLSRAEEGFAKAVALLEANNIPNDFIPI